MTQTGKLFEQIRDGVSNEMATTLVPEDTGLPVILWLTEKGYAAEPNNRPRVKVFTSDHSFEATVAVDDPIEIIKAEGEEPVGLLEKLVPYIERNRDLIMEVWEARESGGWFTRHQTKLAAKYSDELEKFDEQSILMMTRTLGVLNALLSDGVVERYAIGGTMGMIFIARFFATLSSTYFVLYRRPRRAWV